MQSTILKWVVGAGAALALIACTVSNQAAPAAHTPTVTQPPPAASSSALAGWYIQHAGQRTFQPCGQSAQWRIGAPADLDTRAKTFGLDDDNPVYVRVTATMHESNKTIDIVRVAQFGSPTPVGNCAMEGVVRHEPAPQ